MVSSNFVALLLCSSTHKKDKYRITYDGHKKVSLLAYCIKLLSIFVKKFYDD